jgi:hypothetical protein
MEETKKTGIGSIVGTIIIVALIVLGGLYFWGKRLEESKNVQDMTGQQNQVQTMSAEEQQLQSIRTTSSSDELSSIEADLNATNLDNLDTELNVEAE